MPKLTVEGFAPVEVESGKRLVLAIEQDAHVDVLHACGGNARCTTCRVEFIAGKPSMTCRPFKPARQRSRQSDLSASSSFAKTRLRRRFSRLVRPGHFT